MSLAARIAARSRRPTATVRLGGVRWVDVLTLSREQQYGQGVSGGQVEGRSPPVRIVEGATTISWSWGYDGFEVDGFTGVVVKILEQSYPNRVVLQVADPLWRADIRQGDIATSPLNNITAKAAVDQILGNAGVSRRNIPTLPASGSAWAGSSWVLGTLTPVSFSNTKALAAAESICATLGYWLSCDAAGVARATLMERRPSGSPARTLRWMEDFLFASPPQRERDAAAVRNKVVVRGANTGVEGAQIVDSWQTGAADRVLEVAFPLIEFVNESQAGAASATAVAKRLLNLWSRQPNVIDIGKLKADPRLAVGQTVAIQCALIGYPNPTPFFIYSLSSSCDLRRGDFSQSLTLDGGIGTQGFTTIPPPIAAFRWRIVRQTLNGVGVVELFLDATSSTSATGGEIVAYSWTTATTVESGTPSTATGPRAMLMYPGATVTASVTLTVTDTSSKQGSITQVIPLAGDAETAVFRRTLSVALGSAWAASPDGGQTWRVQASGDATLVPEVSGLALLATRASGSTGLRQSRDVLTTASTTLASLGATITALAQTIRAPERVWAATGATVRRSTDGGQTFTSWGALPATVTAILEDPAVRNSVFALAGPTMYQTTSPTGGGWVAFFAGPSGATARHLVRGQSGATTWICYTGTFSGSPLRRVEGDIQVAFPVVSPTVSEIRAMALSLDEQLLIAIDQAGRIWRINGQTGGSVTASAAALAAGETAQHAIWDLDDDIVYIAAFGSSAGVVRKYFPLTDSMQLFYQAASGQQAHRVGLQVALDPLTPITIYSSTTGSLGRNLGALGIPPDGWALIGYDTSAWVAVSTSSYALNTNLEPAAATITATGGGSAGDDDVQITRQTFALPAGRIDRARLRVCVDNFGEVYLNGGLVSAVDVRPGDPRIVTTLQIVPDMLISGADNVIAVRIQNIDGGPPSPVGTAYVLDINYPAEAP